MAITAAMVKELREKTGAGMMDCKKALSETNGDFDAAIDFLREKGLASAAKKAGRIAAEGVVTSNISADGKKGVVVEVNCETDFVAGTPDFKEFAADIAKQITESHCETVEALLAEKSLTDAENTVADVVKGKIAKIGENISIRRFARYTTDGVVSSYIHGGGRIGVLVEIVGAGEEIADFARDIAMQIAAANPSCVTREEVNQADIEHERKVLREQALAEGKPEKIVEKMVEGRLEKYYKEVCLLDQAYIKDPDINVAKLVDAKAKEIGKEIKIARFTRYQLGEGIEKKADNFAEEVMAAVK